MFRVLSYGLMAGLWVGSLTYDVLYIPSVVNGPNSSWFHKLKYLTFINMVSTDGSNSCCDVTT